jgi:hypothetical protein
MHMYNDPRKTLATKKKHKMARSIPDLVPGSRSKTAGWSSAPTAGWSSCDGEKEHRPSGYLGVEAHRSSGWRRAGRRGTAGRRCVGRHGGGVPAVGVKQGGGALALVVELDIGGRRVELEAGPSG